MIIRLYTILLRLYPQPFKAEFADEMLAVFEETMLYNSGVRTALQIFLREIRDLPGTLFDVYVATWLKGGEMSTINDYISPSTRWQAYSAKSIISFHSAETSAATMLKWLFTVFLWWEC